MRQYLKDNCNIFTAKVHELYSLYIRYTNQSANQLTKRKKRHRSKFISMLPSFSNSMLNVDSPTHPLTAAINVFQWLTLLPSWEENLCHGH